MVDRLPLVRPFTPARLRWRLADARIEGPGSFGLAPEVVTTDGGGFWTASFGDMAAMKPAEHRALRSFATMFRGGVILDVPFLEQQPLGGLVATSFDDGTTFSDGSGWESGLVTAELAEACALRADTLKIRITSDHQMNVLGDAFSLLRSLEEGSELHIAGMVEQIDDQVWSVPIGPQTRRAYPSGYEVEFNQPCCAMRFNDTDGGLWPEFTRGWNPRASTQFQEAIR